MKLPWSAVAPKIPFFGYYIFIHPRASKLTDKQLTGLLAHETAHTEQEKRMNVFQLFMLYLNFFISKDKQTSLERGADKITIKRGFGKELLAHRKLQWTALEKVSKKKMIMIKKYYFSPEEIRKRL